LKIGLFDNLSDKEYSLTKAFESGPKVELGSKEEVEWEDNLDYNVRAFWDLPSDKDMGPNSNSLSESESETTLGPR